MRLVGIDQKLVWRPICETKVYCGFTDCIYNKDEECTKDTIFLYEEVEDIFIGCPDAVCEESEVEE